MPTFSFKPNAEDEERIRIRREESHVWLVRLRPMVERLFCTAAQSATVARVEHDMGAPHSMRRMPTDREGVWCTTFDPPLETVAVEHEVMAALMRVLRANGCHGRYREAGTERWYEF